MTVFTHLKSIMSMPIETETQTSASDDCAGCHRAINDRFLLKALEMYWHEDCLKCGCCDCRLGEVGSTLYTKGNLILCKRDYLRLFGTTGYCSACNKVIPAFEMVMRARANVYHLECFACQQCNHRFCVGDRFFLCDNKVLCEYDYEERMVFANFPSSGIAHIKHITNRNGPFRQNERDQGQSFLNYTRTNHTSQGQRLPNSTAQPSTDVNQRNVNSQVKGPGDISPSIPAL
ncbi:hypothetical protein TCAL_08801 [Tigriopus californicus]|uniref:LIM zinc-binding domain-containing protein n=1 Tax=Tigriopus californicus TaxID=6832 RepID=A0A553P626_TIGCA|nr:LIM domain only protein 3-like [Tigriopus californicus]TRY73134.1 hypothetical protein TCAL_08801 [Tigriopus californicus]